LGRQCAQAVIRPGLSFRDQKRDTDAVTEPQRDEEASPSLSLLSSNPHSLSASPNSPLHLLPASSHALDAPEERHAQSRHHGFFACEGAGVGSMLRTLGSGVRVARRAGASGGGEMDVAGVGLEEGQEGEDFSALRAFQAEVEAAVAHHTRKGAGSKGGKGKKKRRIAGLLGL
ncbi:hypothetical protein JCM10207_006149, partial [Rhodosporidiobolus poonsookiae]